LRDHPLVVLEAVVTPWRPSQLQSPIRTPVRRGRCPSAAFHCLVAAAADCCYNCTPAALGWCSWRARFARVAYKSSKAPTGRHSCLRCPPSPPAPSWKLMDVSGRSLSPAALQLMIRLQAPCIVGAKRVGGMCDDGELASSLVQIVMEIARRFYPTRICPATSMAT
jgi:hypothetical protein